MLEYVTSRAAGWNSPISFRGELKQFQSHPRTPDNLEVLKRWEDVRVRQWLKPEDKQRLRDLDREHILLTNEAGQYELQEYEQIEGTAGGSPQLRAFILERRGSPWIVFWHSSGEGWIEIPPAGGQLRLFQDLAGNSQPVVAQAGRAMLPLSGRRYLRCEGLSRAEAVRMFMQARLL